MPDSKVIDATLGLQPNRPYDNEYRELSERYEFHKRSSAKRTTLFARLNAFMQWSIPILSGLATAFMAFSHTHLAGIASATTTLLATINSSVQPKSRYNHYVDFVNRFYAAHLDLRLEKDRIEAEAISEAEKNHRIFDLLKQRNSELEGMLHQFNVQAESSRATPNGGRKV